MAAVQRRAIESWLQLSPRPEIFLFGNEPGVEQICGELRLIHIGRPVTLTAGVVKIGEMARIVVEELTDASYYIFTDSDVILTQNLLDAVSGMARQSGRFQVTHGIEGGATQPSTHWEDDLHQLARAADGRTGLRSTDLIIHRRGLLSGAEDVVVDRASVHSGPKWLVREGTPREDEPDLMEIPSISVIVPHHNRTDFLLDALLSIRAQTVQPMEILVVDDNSNPEHRKRLESYAGLATILHTPANLGNSGARNFGAQHAKGEWLAFLDDDDTYVPDKLESQVRYLQNHPECDAVGCGLTMISSDGRKEYWGSQATGTVSLPDALRTTAAMSQGLLIRRDVYQRLGGFDQHRTAMEDYEFGIRLIAAGYRLDFVGEPLFIYRRGGRDQITKQWGRMFRAELGVVRQHGRLFRREFGALGPFRKMTSIWKRHGLRKGGLVGRSIWAAGCLCEAFTGPLRA
jgi:GT2 family glycosyltransferase